MLNIEKNQNRTTHLYMEVYEYYRKLILDGKMTPGSKMPSLRKCSQELKLSRTTIETAYLQLAADGYIVARAQSGYYVTSIADQKPVSTAIMSQRLPPTSIKTTSRVLIKKLITAMTWHLQVWIKKAFVLTCGAVT